MLSGLTPANHSHLLPSVSYPLRVSHHDPVNLPLLLTALINSLSTGLSHSHLDYGTITPPHQRATPEQDWYGFGVLSIPHGRYLKVYFHKCEDISLYLDRVDIQTNSRSADGWTMSKDGPDSTMHRNPEFASSIGMVRTRCHPEFHKGRSLLQRLIFW